MRKYIGRTIEVGNQTFQVVDDPTYRQFWDEVCDGTWEPETFAVLQSFITQGSLFVDIGSWIGPMVLFGSSLGASCVAVEPDPTAREALQQNLALNEGLAETITLSEKCIAAENKVVTLGNPFEQNGGDSQSSMLFENPSCAWEVPGITLDSFFEEHKITECSLLKIDIEGGESLVIPSAREVLEKHRPTIYLSLHAPLMHDSRGDIEKIVESLSMYPFMYSNLGRLIPPSLVLTPTNLERFFEVIVTDIPPSEIQRRSLYTPRPNATPEVGEEASLNLESQYLRAYEQVNHLLQSGTTEQSWHNIQRELRESSTTLQGGSPQQCLALGKSLESLLGQAHHTSPS